MIVRDAIAAYAHYAAILATTLALGSELLLYRPALPQSFVRSLQRLDLFYLFAAIALIVTGIVRIFVSEKGWAFYSHNPIFWIKMGLFLTLGILSIWPTTHFLSLSRAPSADGGVTIEPRTFARIRGFLIVEVAILFLIPLCASLMSRGVGLRLN